LDERILHPFFKNHLSGFCSIAKDRDITIPLDSLKVVVDVLVELRKKLYGGVIC